MPPTDLVLISPKFESQAWPAPPARRSCPLSLPQQSGRRAPDCCNTRQEPDVWLRDEGRDGTIIKSEARDDLPEARERREPDGGIFLCRFFLQPENSARLFQKTGGNCAHC